MTADDFRPYIGRVLHLSESDTEDSWSRAHYWGRLERIERDRHGLDTLFLVPEGGGAEFTVQLWPDPAGDRSLVATVEDGPDAGEWIGEDDPD